MHTVKWRRKWHFFRKGNHMFTFVSNMKIGIVSLQNIPSAFSPLIFIENEIEADRYFEIEQNYKIIVIFITN